MKSLKIASLIFAGLFALASVSASADRGRNDNRGGWDNGRDHRDRGGRGDDRGRGRDDRGRDDRGRDNRGGHGGGGWGGGHGGGNGGGWGGGHGGGSDRYWRHAGTACGPQQPWGTSVQCPTSVGSSCHNYQRGQKCFAGSYWQSNFVCTNPYTGQNDYGSYIFEMRECN